MSRLRAVYAVTKKVELAARPVEGGGTARGTFYEADGEVEVEFELSIDEGKLLRQMGRRAAFSKHGVSVLGNGAVKLKVVSKKKVP